MLPMKGSTDDSGGNMATIGKPNPNAASNVKVSKLKLQKTIKPKPYIPGKKVLLRR